VRDTGRLDARRDRVELGVRRGSEMLDEERAVVVDEVERRAVVDIHGRTVDAALRPPDAEDIGGSPGRVRWSRADTIT
jgi:hypothetical protein